jgi:hypothetical protein
MWRGSTRAVCRWKQLSLLFLLKGRAGAVVQPRFTKSAEDPYYIGVMSDAEAKGAHARYLSYEPKGGQKTDVKQLGQENTAPWMLDI